MPSVYSPEDLLLYLYKETSPEQTAAIEQALAEDWTLREKMQVLRAASKKLEQISLVPRTETVLNILHYAAKSQPVNPLN